ncbi:MAG: DegT/DnrJ/EryC1/StrS family aminotransferase [Opitutales bacterium]|nr:DegT/DnrJ/EryC1/StrS family aminotransferase [Opitutales bacterium]
MSELVPYVDLKGQHAELKEEILEAVAGVIDRGDFVLGESVRKFETAFAELCGSKFAIGVNSGTDALILAMRALGIGEGDEVITPPNSFVGSTSAIIVCGANPVFVDVGEDRNIDPNLIETAITPKTKAIMPVHLGGIPAKMEQINAVAKKHEIAVIDDCAQAIGSRYDGQPVGSLGDISCFSLHPLKNLNACGDGGMITTDDEKVVEEIRLLRNLGLKDRNTCVHWSGNSRLDTIQAAILLVKLNHFERTASGRQSIATYYMDALANVSQVRLPVVDEASEPVFHTFVIQVDDRDALKNYLLERGIKTSIHYPTPIHLQPVAEDLGYGEGSFPVAERQAKDILTIPGFDGLTREQMERITQSISDFYNR